MRKDGGGGVILGMSGIYLWFMKGIWATRMQRFLTTLLHNRPCPLESKIKTKKLFLTTFLLKVHLSVFYGSWFWISTYFDMVIGHLRTGFWIVWLSSPILCQEQLRLFSLPRRGKYGSGNHMVWEKSQPEPRNQVRVAQFDKASSGRNCFPKLPWGIKFTRQQIIDRHIKYSKEQISQTVNFKASFQKESLTEHLLSSPL